MRVLGIRKVSLFPSKFGIAYSPSFAADFPPRMAMQLIKRVDVGTTRPHLEVSIQWQPRPADGEGTVLNLNQELAGSAAQLAAL